MDLEQRFYKTYNSLPLGLRGEIILSINDESITWKVARLEIDNHTPLSKEILEKLGEIGFI
ncbi:MAG: hypothetical protein AAB580_04470 [Patescibacteria group bacterium]